MRGGLGRGECIIGGSQGQWRFDIGRATTTIGGSRSRSLREDEGMGVDQVSGASALQLEGSPSLPAKANFTKIKTRKPKGRISASQKDAARERKKVKGPKFCLGLPNKKNRGD